VKNKYNYFSFQTFRALCRCKEERRKDTEPGVDNFKFNKFGYISESFIFLYDILLAVYLEQ
jgi:hypothetical protein